MARYLSLVALLCMFTLSAQAQFRAALQGTVRDETAAVIAGARITAQHQATGLSHQTESGDAGFYRLTGLAPGQYTVTVEAPTFRRSVTSDVEVRAEETRGLDITLQPGGAQEVVSVTDVAPPVQSENATVSTTISELQVSRLPQFGRDPYELIRLAPGMFGDAARTGSGNVQSLPNNSGPGGSNTSIFQVENQVQVSAAGQRVSANNFQLDGVSVNSLQWGGAAVVTPSQESVKEMTVSSSSYSAEDGRNSGAQVKIVTQSGTNLWHGGAWFQYNDPGLNAFNGFSSLTPDLQLGPPERVENRFRQGGAKLGGPISRDRAFFFFNWEGLWSDRNNTISEWVETPEFRQAVIAQRPGGVTAAIFQQPGIEPRILQVLSADCAIMGTAPCQAVSGGLDIGSLTGSQGEYVELGNLEGGGLDGIPDIQFAQIQVPQRTRRNQFMGRFDFLVGLNQFFVSSFVTRGNDLNSSAPARSRPMADIAFQPLNSTITAAWVRTLGSLTLNEFRVNFTRFHFDTLESSAETNFGVPLVEVEGLPFDRIRFGPMRGETEPAVFAQNTYELRNTVSRLAGRHGLKFGGEFRWEQDNNNLLGGARPVYSFVRLWNLANDTPIFEAINLDPRTGTPTDAQRHFRTQVLGAFFQDDWKVRQNLTLNLGVRYEYFTPLKEKDGILSNLELGANGLLDAQVVQAERFSEPDRNNFAPRLGFAWMPDRFGGIVFRGGFGMGYNRIPNVLFANSRGNPPFMARFNICCGTADSDFGTPFANGQILYALGSDRSPLSFPPNPALAQEFGPDGLPVVGSVEIWGAPPDLRVGYASTYSLDMQMPLPARLVGSLGYQGSTGRKLIRILNQNFVMATNPKMFAVFFPTSDVNSNHNALLARLSRHFAQGFMFDINYRWSKSMDHLSNEGPGAQTNQTDPANQQTEWGPSDFDATHSFTLNGTWDLPIFRGRSDALGSVLGGWQLSGILTAHSGFPWTPKTGRQESVPVTGAASIRPVRPVEYFGGAGNDHSRDAFLPPGGNFPGGGENFFDITQQGPPGIGRNSFRGPRYFSVDLSVAKEFALPAMAFIGESGRFRLRANFLNAFNRMNLAPFGFFSSGTFVEDPRFGFAERALAGRVVELQGRFEF